MSRIGYIKHEDIKKIENLMRDPIEFDNWMDFIRDTEPEFYSYTQDVAASMINGIAQSVRLNLNNAHVVARCLLSAFICGYAIMYYKDSDRVNNLIKGHIEDKFDLWLNGKLPDNFYNYSLAGLDKKSTKYKAKTAHIDIKRKIEEEKILANGKKDFSNIMNSIVREKITTNSEDLVSDDDIRKLDE